MQIVGIHLYVTAVGFVAGVLRTARPARVPETLDCPSAQSQSGPTQ